MDILSHPVLFFGSMCVLGFEGFFGENGDQ